MKIESYSSYFHDGTLLDIKQQGDYLQLLMESGTIPLDNDFQGGIELSNYSTIRGVLHLSGVTSITLKDENQIIEVFTKDSYDNGDIYHLEINKNSILIVVTWHNYSPHRDTDMFTYEIEAKKIFWKNMPTYFDAFEEPIDDMTSFFQGGCLGQIKYHAEYETLDIQMESVAIDINGQLGCYSLSSTNTLKGCLSLDWVKRISKNGKLIDGSLLALQDSRIVNFAIGQHKIFLDVVNAEGLKEYLEIEAGAILWRDEPNR